MAFIRVRKSVVKPDTWIKPDGFDYCMVCWKDYMQIKDREGHYASVHLQGGAIDPEQIADDSDVYARQRKDDLEIAVATNAKVDSLIRLHYWAICKAYGVREVWNFPNADFMTTFEVAKVELEKMLRYGDGTSTKF
jgi:hypothetical protein